MGRTWIPNLAKSLGSVLAANVLSAVLGFAILAMLARQLSPAEFGLLAPLVGVLDISQVLIDAVVAAGAVHVAVRKLKSNPDKADMAFKIAFCIRAGLAVVLAVVAIPLAPWLSTQLFDSPARASELRLVFIAVPALAIFHKFNSRPMPKQAVANCRATWIIRKSPSGGVRNAL